MVYNNNAITYELILQQLLCDRLESKSDVTSLYDTSVELLNSKGTKRTFPVLDANKINEVCDKSSDDGSEDGPDLCR